MAPRLRTSDEAEQWHRAAYDAHARPLLAYFLRRVAPDHADDLAAEVFLTAWRRRATAPGEPDLGPWLFKIARNVLRNHRRATTRRQRLDDRLRADAVAQVADEQPVDPSDVSAPLQWAMARLREPDREILQLAAWEQCTTSDLATVLGCSANAAAVRLHRARGRLRKILAEAPHPPAGATTSSTSSMPTKPKARGK